MRILHTSPDDGWGGREERVLETALWQLNHGHEAWIATPPHSDLHRNAATNGLTVLDCAAIPFARSTARLRRIVARRQIDIVDCHGALDTWAAVLAGLTVPVIHTRHRLSRDSDFTVRDRYLWRHLDHVIAVAAAIERELIDQSVVDKQRLSTVGEWVLPRFFVPQDPTRVAQTRSALGIDKLRPVLLTVSMLRQEKGVEVLLRAAALARQSVPGLQVLIVGGRTSAQGDTLPELQQLRALGHALGLSDCLITTGFRNDVATLMHCADLLIVPSLREAQSRVIPQAFASRLPVVASSVGGIPELISDGETGWLTRPGDHVDLAKRLVACLEAPIARAEVAERACQFARARLGQDEPMQNTITAYATACERRATAQPAKPLARSTRLAGPDADNPFSGLHVMIVVAHQDDEALGTGASLHAFGRVTLVHVTDGAPDDETSQKKGFVSRTAYAQARMQESRRALARAGIDITFLRLPIRDQRAAFHMADLAYSLHHLFNEFAPDVILTHAFEGGHPDHDATAFAVHTARHGITPSIPIFEMAGYHYMGDHEVFGSFIPRDDIQPIVLRLSRAKRIRKRLMLRAYVSQQKVIACFPLDAERFRPAPRCDFSARPHDGSLFYERYSFGITWEVWLERVHQAASVLARASGSNADAVHLMTVERFVQTASPPGAALLRRLRRVPARAHRAMAKLLSPRESSGLKPNGTILSDDRGQPSPAGYNVGDDRKAADPPAGQTQLLNRAQIIEGISTALERGQKHTLPYLHYEFRPFSAEVYAMILRNLPEDHYYMELKHPDAARPNGTSARLVLPFNNPALVARLPSTARNFWMELQEVLCGDELREIFKHRFEADLINRFKCDLSDIPAIPKLMLMRDLAWYKINVHPDINWKVITTQYYLPSDDTQPHLGTGIYQRDTAGQFTETHRMRYIPNNAYAFAVTKNSWHAVEPIGEIPRPRNSMMLIYFRDNEHDY